MGYSSKKKNSKELGGNEVNSLIYNGKTDDLYKIESKNILLNILTLGVYAFWGRTKIKRYLFANTTLSGSPLEYTGQGKELFLGSLKALGVLLPSLILCAGLYMIVLKFASFLEIPLNICYVLIIYYLFNVAVYSTYHYRVTHLKWRGLQGHLTGSAFYYGLLSFKCTLWNVFSLGYTKPRSDYRKMAYVYDNLYVGNTKVSFNGDFKELESINFITLLLSIPTLGYSRFWYEAALLRYQAEHLSIGEIKFSTTITGEKLFRLSIANFFIILFSLGLGVPFALHRKIDCLTQNFKIIGNFTEFEKEQMQKKGVAEQEKTKILDLDITTT